MKFEMKYRDKLKIKMRHCMNLQYTIKVVRHMTTLLESHVQKKRVYMYLLIWSLLKLHIVNLIFYYFLKAEFEGPKLQNPAILLLDREQQIWRRIPSCIWNHPWSGGQWTKWWRQQRRWASNKFLRLQGLMRN